MKIKTVFAALLMSLSSLFNIRFDKALYSNSTGVFESNRDDIKIDNNSYFSIGDINMSFKQRTSFLTSPFTIQFAQNYWNPDMDINVSYNNKNYSDIYIYRHFNPVNKIDHDFGAFFGELKIPYIMIGDSVTIKVSVILLNPRIETKFSFQLTNPNRVISIHSEPKKIYTSFIKSVNSDLGYNYYKAFKVNEIGTQNMYYYSHFDVNKQLSVYTNDFYSIKDAMLYVYDINTTLFNNLTFEMPGYGSFYRFFNLLARQDLQTGNYSFTFGKDYYFDPVTNLMSLEKTPDNLLTNSNLYFPINNYSDFKNTRVGLILECKVNNIIFTLRHDFNLSFQENYYKDEVVVYKEIKKTTRDENMEEIIL